MKVVFAVVVALIALSLSGRVMSQEQGTCSLLCVFEVLIPCKLFVVGNMDGIVNFRWWSNTCKVVRCAGVDRFHFVRMVDCRVDSMLF